MKFFRSFNKNSVFISVLFLLLYNLPATAQKHSKHKKTVLAKKYKDKILYGQASYYAEKFKGRRTANGEIFSQKKLTAACNKLPLGTWIQVENLKNGKIVVVKINDRLHPKNNRLVDLTTMAAKKLGYIGNGLAKVKVEVLDQELYH